MNTYIIGKTDAVVVVDSNNDFSNEKGSLYVKGVAGEETNEAVHMGIKKMWQLPFGHKVFSLDAHHEGHYEFEMYGTHALINTWGQHVNDNLKFEHDQADEVLLKGEDIGTLFVPNADKMQARERWLHFFAKSKGNLTVDIV